MKSLSCNVVLLPSQAIKERSIATSRDLHARGTLFTLEEGAYFPHLSVYMLQLKEDAIETAKALLADIAQQTAPVTLTAQQYAQSDRYLDVSYAKIASLAELQQDVIAVLNPIRDGLRPHDMARIKNASGLTLANLQQYGWRSVGDLYRPHLTLTRFTADQEMTALNLPVIEAFNGSFEKLGLFEMGENGTCVRKIMEFELLQ